MNNSNNTIKTGFKVIDITGKMDGYVNVGGVYEEDGV